MKKKTLNILSDMLVGGAAGVIIDTLVGTSFVFTAVGLVAGIVLAICINKKKG